MDVLYGALVHMCVSRPGVVAKAIFGCSIMYSDNSRLHWFVARIFGSRVGDGH